MYDFGYYTPDSKDNNDLLKILEVKEVYPPYLFPNMEKTAFIVKYHFKAISPKFGKIDLVFEIKYLIYKIDDWY